MSEQQFAIQRLYLKGASLELPNSPQMFRSEWKPTVELELETSSSELEPGVYEVALNVTATTKVADKVAFLVEVKQAGIFTIQSFPTDQIGPMLGIVCPNILFPYAREVISDLVMRGSFPQLNLEPVNFEALYARANTPTEQAVSQKDDVSH